jgi:hypothetical protein
MMTMDEMKNFRVTFFGPPETRKRVGKRLDRYFRDRCITDQKLDGGSRDVELRNRTKIVCRELSATGAFREPFIEMRVTTTDTYIARSSKAVRDYAMKANLTFDMSVEPIKEEIRRSNRPPSQQVV